MPAQDSANHLPSHPEILSPDEPTVCAGSYAEFLAPPEPLLPPPALPMWNPAVEGSLDLASDTLTCIEQPLFFDDGYTLETQMSDLLPLSAPDDDSLLANDDPDEIDTVLELRCRKQGGDLAWAETLPARPAHLPATEPASELATLPAVARQDRFKTARIAVPHQRSLFRRLFGRRR